MIRVVSSCLVVRGILPPGVEESLREQVVRIWALDYLVFKGKSWSWTSPLLSLRMANPGRSSLSPFLKNTNARASGVQKIRKYYWWAPWRPTSSRFLDLFWLVNYGKFKRSFQVEGVKAGSMVKQIHLLKETRQVIQLPLLGVYQMKK